MRRGEGGGGKEGSEEGEAREEWKRRKRLGEGMLGFVSG